MEGLIFLLIVAGLIVWLFCYIFYKTLIWVIRPLFEDTKDAKVENIETDDGFNEGKIKIDDDFSSPTVKITKVNFGKSFEIPRSLYEDACYKPQKLPGSNLWIYRDSVLSSKSAKKKLSEVSREKENFYRFVRSLPKGISREPEESFICKGHVLFSMDLITLDLKSRDKKDVIREMVGLFIKSDKIKDGYTFYQNLLYREYLGSTGMEDNVAMPYSSCDTKEDIVVAVAISKEGVNFDSFDDKPTKIIFMSAHDKSLLKGTTVGIHLKWLARISRLLQDDKTRQTLINAKSKKEVFSFLKNSLFQNKR